MIRHISALIFAQLPVSVSRALVSKSGRVVREKGHKPKQLLVDVSEVIKHDARTGIQRVVRGILPHLMENPPAGYEVRPVFAERNREYRYAPITSTCLQAGVQERRDAEPATADFGDIFLGLDLAAHLLPRHQDQLYGWKRRGVRLCFLVYDILPLLHPHWFNPKRRKTFDRWLRTLAIYGDDLICISETVKGDLQAWLSSRYGLSKDALRLRTIPLGADIDATMPSTGLEPHHQAFLVKMEEVPSVLMVGTLEPRKGYGHVLDAFELLWQQGHDINLVIAGRPGWKTEPLQQRLRSNAELNRRLFWFDDASDELLKALYGVATGVLLASEAEGFGLPLVEAMHYGKPVLARDIPVFREVVDNAITYFKSGQSESLAKTIHTWLGALSINKLDLPRTSPTWSCTVKLLLPYCGIDGTATCSNRNGNPKTSDL
jgi:glycosyltransferase involved in cell wall biosynthesis